MTMSITNTISYWRMMLLVNYLLSSFLICSAFLTSPPPKTKTTQTKSPTSNTYYSQHRRGPLAVTALDLLPPLDTSHMDYLSSITTSASNAIAAVPHSSVLLHAPSDFFLTLASSYDTSLKTNPLLTKSATAFLLCALGDIIAQKSTTTPITEKTDFDDGTKSISNEKPNTPIDTQRLFRFATKGIISALIWNTWYESADQFSTNLIASTTSASPESIGTFSRIAVTMSLEQFLWAPIVFGLWEIPMATLMNGAGFGPIGGEVKTKLGGLLVKNAYIWTPVNLLLYGVIPSEYRIVFSNCVDVLWQTIMADVAADCGTDEIEARGVVEKGEGDEMADETTLFANEFSNKSYSEGSSERGIEITIPIGGGVGKLGYQLEKEVQEVV